MTHHKSSQVTRQSSKKTRTFTTTAILIASFIASPVFATESLHHVSQAGKHSGLAVAHGTVSVGKAASAVVAVPLLATGSVMQGAGNISGAAGEKLMANATHKKALTVTELTITADAAPQDIMQNQESHSESNTPNNTPNTMNTTHTTTKQETTTVITTHTDGEI